MIAGSLKVDDQEKHWLAEESYGSWYGILPLDYLIQKIITTTVADWIIRGKVRSGQEATVTLQFQTDSPVVLPNI